MLVTRDGRGIVFQEQRAPGRGGAKQHINVKFFSSSMTKKIDLQMAGNSSEICGHTVILRIKSNFRTML